MSQEFVAKARIRPEAPLLQRFSIYIALAQKIECQQMLRV